MAKKNIKRWLKQGSFFISRIRIRNSPAVLQLKPLECISLFSRLTIFTWVQAFLSALSGYISLRRWKWSYERKRVKPQRWPWPSGLLYTISNVAYELPLACLVFVAVASGFDTRHRAQQAHLVYTPGLVDLLLHGYVDTNMCDVYRETSKTKKNVE